MPWRAGTSTVRRSRRRSWYATVPLGPRPQRVTKRHLKRLQTKLERYASGASSLMTVRVVGVCAASFGRMVDEMPRTARERIDGGRNSSTVYGSLLDKISALAGVRAVGERVVVPRSPRACVSWYPSPSWCDSGQHCPDQGTRMGTDSQSRACVGLLVAQ
ncbi:hypothetical protein D9M72_494150 [compost metagenome]